jgi:maltooligosyltrehalose trehalohydrolase
MAHSSPRKKGGVCRGRLAGRAAGPLAEETFPRSQHNLELRHKVDHGTLLRFNQALLRLRREVAAPVLRSKEQMSAMADEGANVRFVRRWHDEGEVILVLCFSDGSVRVKLLAPPGRWSRLLDSSDATWLGRAPSRRRIWIRLGALNSD